MIFGTSTHSLKIGRSYISTSTVISLDSPGKGNYFQKHSGNNTDIAWAQYIFNFIQLGSFSVKTFTGEVTRKDVTGALGEGGYFPSPENLLKDFFATKCLYFLLTIN